MEDFVKLLASELGETRVKTEVDLSEYLATRQKVFAQAFFIATTNRELVKVISLARELKIHFTLLGSGSKISLPAQGLSGLTIKNRSDNFKIFGVKGKVSREGLGIEEAFLEAESGVSLTRLVEYARVQKLTGLEEFAQIPGTLGGSLGSIPAISQKAYQVKILDEDGEIINKQPAEVVPGDIILSVVFKLAALRSV